MDRSTERNRMVELQLEARGIVDPRVLDAFRSIPREPFVSGDLAEFAYRDTPLPIAEGQTISQPYIVALTVQALDLTGKERVLEIGTGSGYAAAILSRLARQVDTVERLEPLALSARAALAASGCTNVRVHVGDGTLGWPEGAPYDAIAVAAGGPAIPPALKEQLAPLGRLVIPVGEDPSSQVLVRVTRSADGTFHEEPLTEVRFVPLIGEAGWADGGERVRPRVAPAPAGRSSVATLIREAAEPVHDIDSVELDRLVERIGDAQVVLLGEASRGTSEFYRMRARITRELIDRKGFRFVAVEADWPDAASVDDYVRDRPPVTNVAFTPFERFPTWMWRNEEVLEFIEWLREWNLGLRDRSRRVGFHGLDLYSMFTSMAVVLRYLDDVDPRAAGVARARYGGLTPWQRDPAAYGEAVLTGAYGSSEREVVAMLQDLLSRRLDTSGRDGERLFDATQNARVVADGEAYYRAMYYGSAASWNLRDTHMFDTLQQLLARHGPEARAVVWEHNSHVGNARATELGVHGELNVGQLSRDAFGDQAYIVGFGTDHGTVAAAPRWDGPMERMAVRPALEGSYERLFHEAKVPACLLHLKRPRREAVREELIPPLLERAIGVVYRPESERSSHYFHASLPYQFDEYAWFDETRAVAPLRSGHASGRSRDLPETYPFGV